MNLPIRILSRARYKELKDCYKKVGRFSKIQATIAASSESASGMAQILQSASLASLEAESSFDVMDIGANQGTWALSFLRRFPQAIVHAVEADPRTFEILKNATEACSNVRSLNLACSSSAGRVTFHSHKNPLLSSINDLPNSRNDTQQVEVQAEKLDDLVKSQNPACLRLVKIDTEGHDLEVLKGADATLKSSSLKFVILEFGLSPNDPRHLHLNKFISFLAQYHFYLAEVGEFGFDHGDIFGNALFCRA